VEECAFCRFFSLKAIQKSNSNWGKQEEFFLETRNTNRVYLRLRSALDCRVCDVCVMCSLYRVVFLRVRKGLFRKQSRSGSVHIWTEPNEHEELMMKKTALFLCALAVCAISGETIALPAYSGSGPIQQMTDIFLPVYSIGQASIASDE